MSRNAKRKKDLRRREREFRERRLSRAYAEPRELDTPPTIVQLFSYDVSFEFMPDTSEPHRRMMREVGGDELQALREQMDDEPFKAISRLESLIQKYPNVPMLFNWLSAVYRATGNASKCFEVNSLNLQRNPHYLFAIVHECLRLLEDDDLEGVEQLLNGRHDVKLMYPERDLFHVTEVTAFSNMMVKYYVKIGDARSAEKVLSTMKTLAPDNADTLDAASAIAMARLRNFFTFVRKPKRKQTFCSRPAVTVEKLEENFLPGFSSAER